jgi:ribosomal protein L40E
MHEVSHGDSMICRHCQARRISRTRGLCRRCFEDEEVRDLYPPRATNGGKNSRYRSGSTGLPEPTDALPGSDEKVLVLIERAARRQELFHHSDALPNGRQWNPARGNQAARGRQCDKAVS